MSRSTGPILAVGTIALFNETIVHRHVDAVRVARIVVGTGVAAGALALFERVNEGLALGLAWVALAAILLVRMDPTTPSPVESFATWYNEKG